LWFKWAEPAQPWIALPLVLTVEEIALFKWCTKITVGNGAKTSVWKDRWLNVKAPQDIAPDCFKLAWRKNQTVVAALPTRRWMRGLRRISSEHEHELRKFIELWTQLSQFQMTDEEDTITWRFSPNGCYSAKSAYMVQFIGAVTDRRWKLIWKAKVELKCRFFVWLLLQFRLPTASLMIRQGRQANPICSLCHTTAESHFHMIVTCTYAKAVWQQVAIWLYKFSYQHKEPQLCVDGRNWQRKQGQQIKRNSYRWSFIRCGIYGKRDAEEFSKELKSLLINWLG
jgi:hypothetical protein